MSQFSLFGAAAVDPGLDDLDGVLLAGGHWVRSAGAARASIVVGAPWRAAALTAEFAARGVGEVEQPVVAAENGLAVRTGFTAELVPQALRWSRGANEGPPPGFVLSAGGLRLWAIAAGHCDETGYLLATPGPHEPIHLAAGAQLSRLGLAAVSLGSRAAGRGGPGWRITSAKRIRRLVELLGPAPEGGNSDWP